MCVCVCIYIYIISYRIVMYDVILHRSISYEGEEADLHGGEEDPVDRPGQDNWPAQPAGQCNNNNNNIN